MTLRAAVIGAGNIAQGFDNPQDETVLTHVKGYQKNPAFELIAVQDSDADKAQQAAHRWNIPLACRDEEELFAQKPEVISICTPDHTHQPLLWKCLESPARLVFCEKPLCQDAADAARLVAAYAKAGKSLAVNYSRRWLPPIMALCPESPQQHGRLLSARIKYYKGFYHNGSHLIDLLTAFAKPQLKYGAIVAALDDCQAADQTITAACALASPVGDFTLMIEGYDGRKMSPLELELIFERKRFLLEELNGTQLTESSLCANALYPDFFEFSASHTKSIPTERAMSNAMQNLAAHLTDGTPLASTGETALATLRLCQQIYSLNHLRS